jgi:hypothetical protein
LIAFAVAIAARSIDAVQHNAGKPRGNLYGYIPTESTAIIFIVLFGLSTRM